MIPTLLGPEAGAERHFFQNNIWINGINLKDALEDDLVLGTQI